MTLPKLSLYMAIGLAIEVGLVWLVINLGLPAAGWVVARSW